MWRVYNLHHYQFDLLPLEVENWNIPESIDAWEQYCSQDFSLLLYFQMDKIGIFLSESIEAWEQYHFQDFTLFLYLKIQKIIEIFLILSLWKRENNTVPKILLYSFTFRWRKLKYSWVSLSKRENNTVPKILVYSFTFRWRKLKYSWVYRSVRTIQFPRFYFIPLPSDEENWNIPEWVYRRERTILFPRF